jgi:hypothetical protein
LFRKGGINPPFFIVAFILTNTDSQRMEKPVNTWVNDNGSTVRVFATNEPFRFRVTVDNKPFNPNTVVVKGK